MENGNNCTFIEEIGLTKKQVCYKMNKNRFKCVDSCCLGSCRGKTVYIYAIIIK